MGVVGHSQKVLNHVLLRVSAQLGVQTFAQQERIQKSRYHLLELLQQGVPSQHPGDHRSIEALCAVGRQQDRASEGTQEGDEGVENLGQGNGVNGFIVKEQASGSDCEARDLLGARSHGLAWEGVLVKDFLLVDGGHLDDVTR